MFSERLKAQLKKAQMLPADLARKSKVSKQNISRLLNVTPHPVTQTMPSPRRGTVARIAKALDWPLEDALDAAGYKSPSTQKETAKAVENVKMLFRGAGEISEEEWPKFVEELKVIGQAMLDLRVRRESSEKE